MLLKKPTRKEAFGFLFDIWAAAGAFVFLKNVFDEYTAGKSSFLTSYSDILAEDIPTVTFCIRPSIEEVTPDTRPVYGQDIRLKYR